MTDRDKRLDQSAATDQALDDLVCEVSRKLEAGEAVDFEAIAAEHPDHVDRIRELFSTLQAMANLGRPETALPKAPPESHGLGEPNTGILGDFRILREIGRGGMGIIYEAEQLSLHRRMALKVLPFAAVLDRRQLQRFKNEAQAAASLDHPNIVSVHSVGCERGLHYYAMQLIEGQTLAGIIGELGRAAESARKDKRKDEGQSAENVVSRLTQDLAAGQFPAARKKASGDAPTSEFAAEPTPSPVAGDETDRTVQAHVSTSRSIRGRQFFRTVARLGIQAAEALEHAHQMGVVHRDIKPSNLMVDASGHLWVTDFGLAMTKAQTNLTMTGDVVGTLRYMSPEQVQGNRQVMDHRTDLYSLGATLYELLTLRPAVTSNDRHEVIHQIVEEDTRAPRQLSRAIPADLETVVLKAMAKEPKARYATAQEMADDLRRFLEDKPIHARRPTWAQRLAKWSRRHRPILWIVAGAAACVLLAVAIGAALIAHTAELGRQEAEESEQEAEGARQEAEEARRKAEKAQRETARLLAETATLLGASYMDRGQTLCEQGEVGRGMVWLARALQVAPDEAPELLEAIRGKLAAWKRRLHSLRMVVQIPGKVRVVALSPDGSRILAGGTDGAVRMWETAKGRPIGTPLQHSSAVTAVAFSPDGSRIVTGTENGTARLWNAATQKPIGKPLVHEGPVVAVAFNRDGSRIATASSHGTIQAWSATDWKPVGEPLKRGWPRSVAFTSAGLRAVITMEGGKHQLWDVDRKEPVGPALEHRAIATAISPDGAKFATTCEGALIRCWDAKKGELASPQIKQGGVMYALAFSPDGSRIVSGGNTRTAVIWDVATGEPIGIPLRLRSSVNALAFSSDGRRVLVGSDEGAVRLWELAPPKSSGRVLQHEDAVLAAAFGPGGLRIITGHKNISQLRDGTTGDPLGKPVRHASKAGPFKMVISPDGSRVLAKGRCYWALKDATGQPIHPGVIVWMAFQGTFSPDGSRVLLGLSLSKPLTHTAQLRDAVTGKLLGELPPQQKSVSRVAFSPDGSRFLTGSYDGTTRLWDAATLRPIGKPVDHQSEVKALAFGPEGKRMLVGLADGTARLWDLSTLKPIGTPMQHREIVCSVAFSPDGSRLVTCSLDQTARLWDAATLKPIGPPMEHRCSWPEVSFSFDGSQLLISDGGGTAQIWDAPPGPLQGKTERVIPWTQVVTGMELDPSGGTTVLDAPKWQRRYRELQKAGGPPGTTFLQRPVRKAETDFSRSMDLAIRGRNHLDQKRWAQAVADFDAALKLSDDSPMLRAQIAWWVRELSEGFVGQKLTLAGTTVDGTSSDLGAYQKERQEPVLVGFWASGTETGRAELASVQKNYRLFGNRRLHVVGVGKAQGPPQTDSPHPWELLDAGQIKGSIPRLCSFGSGTVPMALLVDEQGKIVWTATRTDDLDRQLQELLGPPHAPSGKLTFLDLKSKANGKLTETLRGGFGDEQLVEVFGREKVFGGVRFQVTDDLIQLNAEWGDWVDKVEGIPVGRRFERLYVLHGAQAWAKAAWGPPEGTVLGRYKVHYEDRTTEEVPIAFGVDVRGWPNWGPVSRGTVVTAGSHPLSRGDIDRLRLYLTTWENPHPEKRVTAIDCISAKTGGAAPFCIAMTVEEAAGPDAAKDEDATPALEPKPSNPDKKQPPETGF